MLLADFAPMNAGRSQPSAIRGLGLKVGSQRNRHSKFGGAGFHQTAPTLRYISPFQIGDGLAIVEDNGVVFNGNFRIDREDLDIGGGIVIGRTVDVALKVKVH